MAHNRQVTKKTRAASTPALAVLDSQQIEYRLHQYQHDANSDVGFGQESAAKLGIDAHRVFKTLMVQVDGVLCTAVVPASGMLNLKAMASAVHGKHAELASPAEAERATGYIVGGISPLGQKRPHPTVIDDSAQAHATILVSGGRRGFSVELSPADLAHASHASFAPIGTA